jgi:hypothetical protein
MIYKQVVISVTDLPFRSLPNYLFGADSFQGGLLETLTGKTENEMVHSL